MQPQLSLSWRANWAPGWSTDVRPGICVYFLKVLFRDAHSRIFWAATMRNTIVSIFSFSEHELFDIQLISPCAALSTRCYQCLCQVSIWDLIIVGKNDDSVIFFSLMGSPCQHCTLKMYGCSTSLWEPWTFQPKDHLSGFDERFSLQKGKKKCLESKYTWQQCIATYFGYKQYLFY